MRLIRYQYRNEAPRYGWILENKAGPIEGNIFGEYRRLEAMIPLTEVKLLAPVQPSKIICVGRNYKEHAKEHNAEVPKVPLIFLNHPLQSSILGRPYNYLPKRNRWNMRRNWLW